VDTHSSNCGHIALTEDTQNTRLRTHSANSTTVNKTCNYLADSGQEAPTEDTQNSRLRTHSANSGHT